MARYALVESVLITKMFYIKELSLGGSYLRDTDKLIREIESGECIPISSTFVSSEITNVTTIGELELHNIIDKEELYG